MVEIAVSLATIEDVEDLSGIGESISEMGEKSDI
jgi:hypothetical protein